MQRYSNRWLSGIFLAIILSLVAQAGDLTISYFKRIEKIKDTGRILPGHGGIFDRIDALMYVVILTFVLYQINKINKVLPNIKNDNSKKKILKVLYEKSKYEYNQKLLNNIRENKFNESNFLKISNDNSIEIKKIKLDSINDTKKFDTDSVKLLYAMPKKSFLLIADEEKNIYVAKIIESYYENIQKSSDEFDLYEREAKINLVNNINASYDFFLNDKYEIKINQKTLERVKNYFKWL